MAMLNNQMVMFSFYMFFFVWTCKDLRGPNRGCDGGHVEGLSKGRSRNLLKLQDRGWKKGFIWMFHELLCFFMNVVTMNGERNRMERKTCHDCDALHADLRR